MKKIKMLTYLHMVIIMYLSIGCSLPKEESINYSICSDTSHRNMAEVESGFFYCPGDILYYADRDNVGKWIAVCNKPECTHSGDSCNAYVPSYFTEKNGKLYGFHLGIEGRPYVYQILTDGSGQKHVYDIPVEENEFINSIIGTISQEQLLLNYGYLGEDGFYKDVMVNLKGDKVYKLYENTSENEEKEYFIEYFHHMQGDDVVLATSLKEENAMRELWRIDGDKLERINLPNGIPMEFSYIEGNSYIYFKEREGFFKLDLKSGEENLIVENQLGDSKGYVLTENYMIETNRYWKNQPENAYMKFYNGEKWIDVELPEEVKNTDKSFWPVSVGTDRIFFSISGTSLYYFMLDEENPKFEHCCSTDRFGMIIENNENSTIIEEDNETQTTDVSSRIEYEKEFEEIVVCDTDEFVLKIIDHYIDIKNNYGYTLSLYWENKTDDTDCMVLVPISSINGMQCNREWGIYTEGGETSENKDNINFIDFQLYAEMYHVDEVYNPSEYKQIELIFYIKIGDEKIEKTVTIYPQDDIVEKYIREVKDTDEVLIDNEDITVIVTGYDSLNIENDIVQFFFINKTNERLMFNLDGGSVNGVELDWSSERMCDIKINSKSCGYKDMDLSDIMHMNNITNIEELALLLRVYPVNINGSEKGEDLINELVILKPE